MQVGSLVECVKAHDLKPRGSEVIKIGTRLNVRDVSTCGCGCHRTLLLFEEYPNYYWSDGDQYAYAQEYFRELLPPMDILAEIEKATEAPLPLPELVPMEEELV